MASQFACLCIGFNSYIALGFSSAGHCTRIYYISHKIALISQVSSKQYIQHLIQFYKTIFTQIQPFSEMKLLPFINQTQTFSQFIIGAPFMFDIPIDFVDVIQIVPYCTFGYQVIKLIYYLVLYVLIYIESIIELRIYVYVGCQLFEEYYMPINEPLVKLFPEIITILTLWICKLSKTVISHSTNEPIAAPIIPDQFVFEEIFVYQI
ncbi:Hypothetical_protein [Hexamita inflata]|uniref:Hypothetical_protein n=1 Tax=Hexamita inflata TaxID=28002 RepID=A0AA86UAU3_9EUKA|nr:Hypothetical protein HINF_LOCUS35864 [Hexamita inflata]CAI9948222.1 Hypothetical protein HINF_LOCUS35867 [Hexamita inflata]CAI9970999.1 Hypothetical protein HINF_LOCUS58644 [Hexamita inflata]